MNYLWDNLPSAAQSQAETFGKTAASFSAIPISRRVAYPLAVVEENSGQQCY